MVKFVTLIRFTEAGAKGIKQSTARASDFRKSAEKMGVKVDAQYWTVGAYDGILVLSADNEQKILRCLADLTSAGNVRTQTLRAFDAGEFEALIGK